MLTTDKPTLRDLTENLLSKEICFALESPRIDMRIFSNSKLGLVILGRSGQDLNAELVNSAND